MKMISIPSLFAAVALSVIDTSSSNFFAENWTQFPYLEIEGAHQQPTSQGEVDGLLESSNNNNPVVSFSPCPQILIENFFI